MHKKFRLLFWSEIILAFIFLFVFFSFSLLEVMFFFEEIQNDSSFSKWMADAVYYVSVPLVTIAQFIWPFVNLLFAVTLIISPLVIYNAPVKYYKACKSTPETPKAGTYWWKLCISGGLLVIALIVYAWMTIQAIMGF